MDTQHQITQRRQRLPQHVRTTIESGGRVFTLGGHLVTSAAAARRIGVEATLDCRPHLETQARSVAVQLSAAGQP